MQTQKNNIKRALSFDDYELLQLGGEKNCVIVIVYSNINSSTDKLRLVRKGNYL